MILNGLPYTIQESLQYKTPCIVTDVGGCTELIEEGKNGYIVPLDMNFDVKKILKIPKCSEYDNHALEDWLEYLGDSVYIKKEENKKMKYKVRATDEYAKKGLQDAVLGRIPKAGEVFEVTEDRFEMLNGNNSYKAIFVEKVKEVETAKKKTTTRKAVQKTIKKSK